MDERAESAIVEVAYGKPEEQVVVALPWTQGLTAREAVEHSELLDRFPEIDPAALVLGIFGRRIPESTALKAGDRVEICRPLHRDPRDMRRDALASGAVMGRLKT